MPVHFNEDGILCAYEGDMVVFKWTYNVFEDYAEEVLTPSMYHFMANHLMCNLNEDVSIDYCPGYPEAEAVDAYYDTPLVDRMEMHEQEMENLKDEHRHMAAKQRAAADWLLDDEHNPENPIYIEMCAFMRELYKKYEKKVEEVQRRIDEEEQWRGGHEEGASDDEGGEGYDHMEEI